MVAGRDYCVMYAWRGVFNDRHQCSTIVCDQGISDLREYGFERGMHMLHRHVLLDVVSAKRPEVADLGTVRILNLQ